MPTDTSDGQPGNPIPTTENTQRDERPKGRGRLKLFVGFAAGVGKTYAMLSEANRRKSESGQDVVIGFVETHNRPDTIAIIDALETVPRRKYAYNDVEYEEMDTEAVIARRPHWVLVDEIAHTNTPGSRHANRYEDVIEILNAGINVESTLNIQNLESLNDTIYQITNVRVRETMPDWVLGEADEMVTVDISPRALINRIKRGDVYPTDKVPQALSNFFREGNLSALRELALREVASEVDLKVQNYRNDNSVDDPWHTQERIMVAISPDKTSDRLLRRGWRVARRLRAEIIAVYVINETLTQEQQNTLDADFVMAERLSIRIEKVAGSNVPKTLAEYAKKHQVSQIVIGHSLDSRWVRFWKGSIINRLIALVPDIDVLVIANAP